MNHTIDRLHEFYGQLPTSGCCRKVYGRIINLVQYDRNIPVAKESARQWFDRCRHEYEVQGNSFWALDFGAAGCLMNILSEA